MKKQKNPENFYFKEMVIWIAIIFLFFLDRFSKELIQNKIFNSGISFSLFSNTIFFPLILLVNLALLILIILIYFRINQKERRNNFLSLGFIFIISGAIGNLYDRIFYGAVIDFIHISNYFPTFNLADIFNFIGVVLIIIYLLKKK